MKSFILTIFLFFFVVNNSSSNPIISGIEDNWNEIKSMSGQFEQIDQEGKGVLVYMNQEGRGIGLLNKLKAYELQENGRDTVQANHDLGFNADHRDYGIGAQILRALNISKIKLLSNNPKKRVGLIGYGIEIVENVALEIEPNEHNHQYLKTKRDKMGHSLKNIDE